MGKTTSKKSVMMHRFEKKRYCFLNVEDIIDKKRTFLVSLCSSLQFCLCINICISSDIGIPNMKYILYNPSNMDAEGICNSDSLQCLRKMTQCNETGGKCKW